MYRSGEGERVKCVQEGKESKQCTGGGSANRKEEGSDLSWGWIGKNEREVRGINVSKMVRYV